MEADRAIEIVQSLADGVDPYSGEPLPSGSPYQQCDGGDGAFRDLPRYFNVRTLFVGRAIAAVIDMTKHGGVSFP